MDKGLKKGAGFEKLQKLAETIQSAAEDGKLSVIEIVQIGIRLVQSRKEIEGLKDAYKTSSPEEIAGLFGDDAPKLAVIIQHLTGLYTYANLILEDVRELKHKPKKKTKSVKAHDSE